MTLPQREATAEAVSVATARPHRLNYLDGTFAEQFVDPRNFVCLTLYNESVAEFSATLNALLVSLREDGRGRRRDEATSAVFIVADGADRIDPAIRALLVRLALYPDADDDGMVFHHSLHTPSALMAAGEDVIAGLLPLERPVRFITCIKPANRGKLDSHALFFGDLCRTLNPSYCHQLDVGTVIAPGAVRALVDQIEASPDVGGLASRISVAAPRLTDGLLASWQYLDFVSQLAVGWPGEVTAGHLSVLPGQYCVVRWSALRGRDEGASPLGRYLRGTSPSSAVERLMFLAEDRVLGNEIVLAARERWRLDYCPQAHATTGACPTLGELLQQRRRWNNGSNACRVWMFGRWRAELLRPDRTVSNKLRFSLALLWQATMMLQQLLMPTIMICSMSVLLVALTRVAPALATLTVASAVGAWTLALMPTRDRLAGAARDGVALAYLVLAAGTLTVAFGWGAALLLFAPTVAAVLLTAFAVGDAAVLRHAAGYWAVNPPMQILLIAYSLARLDDLSWGTKGLTASPDTAGEQRLMRRLRNALLGGWIVLNAAMTGIGLTTPGFFFIELGPVLEAFSIIALGATLPASLVFFLRRRLARRGGPGAPRLATTARLSECDA